VILGCKGLPVRWLAFRVIDTGHGMRPRQLAQLYAPFNGLDVEASGIEGTARPGHHTAPGGLPK
jgi:signal transduction histidine kinase